MKVKDPGTIYRWEKEKQRPTNKAKKQLERIRRKYVKAAESREPGDHGKQTLA